MPTDKATAKGPSLVAANISWHEFERRLMRAHQNYSEFCRIRGLTDKYQTPIQWLDHFQEFLDLAEIERK